MRFFLEIAYDGTHYGGWQVQPNSTSVQGLVEKALAAVLKSEISTIVAGRTDAGVHALQQYAHFDFPFPLPRRFFAAMNSILPADITLQAVYYSPKPIHARFDAIKRTYEYRISTRKDSFSRFYALRVFKPLSIEQLNAAARAVANINDFAALSKRHGAHKTTICNIFEAYWEERDTGPVFTVSANRFLWGMVRAMVGLMLAFGFGKITFEELIQILHSRSRRSVVNNVPPKGLFLKSVEYPKNSLVLLANHEQTIIHDHVASR